MTYQSQCLNEVHMKLRNLFLIVFVLRLVTEYSSFGLGNRTSFLREGTVHVDMASNYPL